MIKLIRILSFILLLSLLSFGVNAQRQGIVGQEAPIWSVSQWHNLPEGEDHIEVDDFAGKVLYLYCFQSWCPGCHSHGFPTLKEVMLRFQGQDDVAFVAIQTVFEGFHANTFTHGKETLDKFGLEIPMGQSGERGKASVVMARYHTGGTPWVIIIDRKGIVRFNDFHITPDSAVSRVNSLLEAQIEPE